MLTVDLHPIYRNSRDLDLTLRRAILTAARTGEDIIEIIPGKGSGALRKRVLAFLGQGHIRKLYARAETDPTNPGRILVYLR